MLTRFSARHRLSSVLPLLLLLVVLSVAAAQAKPSRKDELPAPPERPAAAGVYLDDTGTRYEWQVTRGHALLWDRKPYLPLGTTFRPRSIHNPEPEAWQHDLRSLDALRNRGVRDLLIDLDGDLLNAPLGALARLVEALRERDFRYGVRLGGGPDDPPVPGGPPPRAYWLHPGVIDTTPQEVAPGATSRWSVPIDVPGAVAALYALVDRTSGSPIHAGRVPVVEGHARIEVSFRPARRLFPYGAGHLIVLPERRVDEEKRGAGLPDLWAAMPSHLDGLLAALRGVRWGAGLRFFLDPVVLDGALRGEVENLLPASSAFRVEFEAWLQRRGGVGDTSLAWGLNDRQLDSLQTAARLVPLWHRDESGPEHGWFLDPETFTLYRADRRRSRFWIDLESFRVSSARRAMNSAADLLKARVAGVPVLYRWTQLHPLFTNDETASGWDGLVTPVSAATPIAYGQCEASARTLWCLAAPSGGDGGAGAEARLAALAAMGIRGYFAPEDEDPVAGGGAREANVAWGEASLLMEQKPPVLFFPLRQMPGFSATRLPNGVWWLPSYASGRMLILGEELEGYRIDLPFAHQGAPTTVVWSPGGRRRATFIVPRDQPVVVLDSLGQPVKARSSKGRLRLELTELPYVLGGLEGETVFPVEATAQALSELEALVSMAEARRLNPNVLIALKAAMADARAVFTERTAATAFDLLRGPLEALRELLSPYIWIEGERPRESRWGGVAPDPSASEGAYLSLSTQRDPPPGGYYARYTVNVNTAGLYEFWLAGAPVGGEGAEGTPPRALTAEGITPSARGPVAEGTPPRALNGGAFPPFSTGTGASPLRWQIERETSSGSPRLPSTASPAPVGDPRLEETTPQRLPAAPYVSEPYAPGLRWSRLGQLRLEPGRYRLTLTVQERVEGHYRFHVDALLFAREPFKPDGIRKPVWRPGVAKRRVGAP